jgi:hypothetical protein
MSDDTSGSSAKAPITDDAKPEKRCKNCARFVRVTETIDQNGEVKRSGDCLLGVWSPPIFENNGCSQWVQKGAFTAHVKQPEKRVRRTGSGGSRSAADTFVDAFTDLELPEDLLAMDKDEFRSILTQVIREELGVKPVELGGRWLGGELVMTPGKKDTQEKRVPIETFFHKIVMIRDRLRVLEQKVNSSKLTDEEKVQMQQYVTACYGSLTTFNVLFAERGDGFAGQKSDD